MNSIKSITSHISSHNNLFKGRTSKNHINRKDVENSSGKARYSRLKNDKSMNRFVSIEPFFNPDDPDMKYIE